MAKQSSGEALSKCHPIILISVIYNLKIEVWGLTLITLNSICVIFGSFGNIVTFPNIRYEQSALLLHSPATLEA